MPLTYEQVRAANIKRLPQFKTKHGTPAHTTHDGHDWTPAQWLQAFIGEVGEYAEVRNLYEAGMIPFEEYRVAAGKEIADFMLYGDILARRALDTVTNQSNDHASILMRAVAALGAYANARKKFERGDMTADELAVVSDYSITAAISYLVGLRDGPVSAPAPVCQANPDGINLSRVIAGKFNEVSRRMSVPVFLPEA